jgi:mRNA-degrading endonuclease RelE of RelBE toxin-antitoxin system
VKYQVRLSSRAAKDLDRLSRDTQRRVIRRLEQLSDTPLNPRLSSPLKSMGDLSGSLDVVTIERRGQVYARI